nr:cation:proton antiporter [Dissulfurirhabdus thermomarina]
MAAAWLLGAIFQRFGLPVMLGELLAGVVLGPALLGAVSASEPLEFLAELGIFFAMFHAGMEMDPKLLLRHFWPSLLVAAGGFLLPFGLGYLVSRWFGGTVFQSLFVGMGLSVTAIAVQAVILQDLGIHRTRVGHVIIGAAIADDVFSLVTLSILIGLAEAGTFQWQALGLVLLKVAAFFGFTALAGELLVPRVARRLTDQGGKAFTFAIVSALVMAELAELAGLHLVIGAFLAGQFVRKEIMDEGIVALIGDRFFAISYGFLTPVFFASLAFHLHFEASWSFALFTGAILIAAVAGKFLGSGAGALAAGLDRHQAAVVGFGMNGRGAVELVVASVVLEVSRRLLAEGRIAEPLLTAPQFSGLVLMAFVTTFLAPLTLKWAARRGRTGA